MGIKDYTPKATTVGLIEGLCGTHPEKIKFATKITVKNSVMFRFHIHFPWVYCHHFSPDTSTNIARWDSAFVVSSHLGGFPNQSAIFRRPNWMLCLKCSEVSNINKETINTTSSLYAHKLWRLKISKNLQKTGPDDSTSVFLKLGAIVIKSCGLKF